MAELGLDAIAARAHMAVAGAGYPLPWQPRAGSNDGRVRAANGAQVADCGGHEARAEFIAHAVEDVPALVAECRRLRAERDELRAGYLAAERSYRGMCETLTTAGEGITALLAERDRLRAENTALWAVIEQQAHYSAAAGRYLGAIQAHQWREAAELEPAMAEAAASVATALAALPPRAIITHVNPNCMDSRRCNPHGETGPVTHREYP